MKARPVLAASLGVVMVMPVAPGPARAGSSSDSSTMFQAGQTDHCSWSEDSNLPDFDGEILSSVVWDDGSGPALYVGGTFSHFGTDPIAYVAKWDGDRWDALTPDGLGPDGPVRQLAVFDEGGDAWLYAGGDFATAGGQIVNHVARWDGIAWSGLEGAAGVGTDGTVAAMAVFDEGYGERLYVGGSFPTAGGVLTNNIAGWDGDRWSALTWVGGIGIADEVTAMTVAVGKLVVVRRVVEGSGYHFSLSSWDGARFVPIEGYQDSRTPPLASFDDGTGDALYAADDEISRWNGAEWSTVVDGAGRSLYEYLGYWRPEVQSLASIDLGGGPALYIAGTRCWNFDGSNCTQSTFVVRWDGDWHVITPATEGLVDASMIMTLAEFDDDSVRSLFAGGKNLADGGVVMGAAGRWDGTSWIDFDRTEGNGLGGGHPPTIRSMASFDEGPGMALFAAGGFTTAGNTAAVKIARWQDGEWSAVVDANGNGACAALGCEAPQGLASLDDSPGGSLYAVATVWCSWSNTSIDVARWTGTRWVRRGGTGCFYNHVNDIAVFDDGAGPAIYGCGLFASWDETVMRFSGSSWTRIPGSGGHPPSGEAKTLGAWNRGIGKGLYVAGNFTEIAGLSVNGFARWDGERWSSPEGPPGVRVASGRGIRDMVVFDDGTEEALFVGGAGLTGGLLGSSVVKWDGDQWWALDDSAGELTGAVAALAVFDDGGGKKLYAATNRQLYPSGLESTVSRWDGDRWTIVGKRTANDERLTVETIFSHDGGDGESLYVGGSFADFAGVRSNGIARLDCTRFDFGDAPQPSYPTLLAADGARHVVRTGFHLGDGLSHETDGKPSANADADDFDDGVAFPRPLIPGFETQIDITSSTEAYLDAWIDFNADGDWDESDERVADHRSVSDGYNTIIIEVPFTAVVGSVTVARFRLSSTGVDDPTGEAVDGEVEDYEIEISVNPTRHSGERRSP